MLTNKLEEKKKIKLLKVNFIEEYNDVASKKWIKEAARKKWIKKVASILISNDIISVKQGDANACLLDGDAPYMGDQDRSLKEKSVGGVLIVDIFLT